MLRNRHFAARSGDTTLGIPTAKPVSPKLLGWTTTEMPLTPQNHAKKWSVKPLQRPYSSVSICI